MQQYLLRHGYWSYVGGANDEALDVTHRDPSAWEETESRVMYFFASSVSNQLLSHIPITKMPKEAWTNLKKVFAASTTARKLQLNKELSNVPHQGDL